MVDGGVLSFRKWELKSAYRILEAALYTDGALEIPVIVLWSTLMHATYTFRVRGDQILKIGQFTTSFTKHLRTYMAHVLSKQFSPKSYAKGLFDMLTFRLLFSCLKSTRLSFKLDFIYTLIVVHETNRHS